MHRYETISYFIWFKDPMTIEPFLRAYKPWFEKTERVYKFQERHNFGKGGRNHMPVYCPGKRIRQLHLWNAGGN